MNRLQTHPATRSNHSGYGVLPGMLLGTVAAALVWGVLLNLPDNSAAGVASAVQTEPTPTPSAPTTAFLQVDPPAQPTSTIQVVLPTAIPIAATPVPAPAQPNPDPLNAWYAEFFNNPDLEGNPIVQRNDPELNFNFGKGSADARLPADNFSGRFKGRFTFDQTENILFSLIVDDAARVYLDDQLIIDEWHMGGRRVASVNVPIVKGEHHLRVDYAETTGTALLALTWKINYDAWQCRYYNTIDWTGPVMLRTNEGTPNGKLIQDWGEGGPGNGVPNDNFSADCRANISVAKTGTYNFKLLADDGMRMYIDGVKIYDTLNGPIQAELPIRLRAGRHTIQTQYVERGGGAAQHIEWDYVPPPPATPVPTPLSGS